MVPRQSGFSLFEVVVAFFITTASLGIIFQICAKGVSATILANEYASALSIAESRLAGIPGDADMRGLTRKGTDEGRYDWEITTADYQVANPHGNQPSSYSLALVEVNVSWQSRGKARRVDLETLKPVIP